MLVAIFKREFILDASTRLDDGCYAFIAGNFHAVGEREECVTCHYSAIQVETEVFGFLDSLLQSIHTAGLTYMLRGTELERQMRAGQYQPQTVEEAVKLCASIYEIFRAAGIPVIRLGLNPTEDLSGGEAVAGAIYPALGELVLSEMYLRRARALLGNTSCREPILLVHPSRVSVMIGQKRRNITLLQEEFGLRSIKVLPEAGELWEITLKDT